MNKIICNDIYIVYASEVESITPEKITLKDGAVWKKIHTQKKPTYSSDIKQTDAGPINDETVTAVTRANAHPIIKQYPNFPVILKLKTDKRLFYVGSMLYPVLTEVSGDQILDTFNFSCSSTL